MAVKIPPSLAWICLLLATLQGFYLYSRNDEAEPPIDPDAARQQEAKATYLRKLEAEIEDRRDLSRHRWHQRVEVGSHFMAEVSIDFRQDHTGSISYFRTHGLRHGSVPGDLGGDSTLVKDDKGRTGRKIQSEFTYTQVDLQRIASLSASPPSTGFVAATPGIMQRVMIVFPDQSTIDSRVGFRDEEKTAGFWRIEATSGTAKVYAEVLKSFPEIGRAESSDDQPQP